MNLGLTLLAKVDVQVDKIGDSTGLLTDLYVVRTCRSARLPGPERPGLQVT